MGKGESSPDIASLHKVMIDRLVQRRVIHSPAVERAFRAVPRHYFLPGVSPQQVYSGEAIVTQYGADGLPTSSSSEPTIMGTMLEQLQVDPGNRILEIGTGTGYNAALLAHLAGKDGAVTTVDIDEDLVQRAVADLERAGYGHVRTHAGDGWLPVPGQGCFDRIEVTVGAWDISPHWIDQLRPGGILVAPLWLRGGLQVSAALQKDGDRFHSVSTSPCGFMPLRGPHAGPATYFTVENWVAYLEGATNEDVARLKHLLNLPPRSHPSPTASRAVFTRLLLEEPRAIFLADRTDFSHLMAGIYDPVNVSLAVVEGYLWKQTPRRLLAFGTDAALLRLRDRLAALPPLDLNALRILALPASHPFTESGVLKLQRRYFQFLVSEARGLD